MKTTAPVGGDSDAHGLEAFGRQLRLRPLPRISPWALYGLLYTVVLLLFALQGEAFTSKPWDVVRIALPLLAYFALMWTGAFALGLKLGIAYDRNATLPFTAAGRGVHAAATASRRRGRGGPRRTDREYRRWRWPDAGSCPRAAAGRGHREVSTS